MDPDANLEEQLRICARMLEPDSTHLDVGDAVRLAELVVALDKWLKRSGFLPLPWAKS